MLKKCYCTRVCPTCINGGDIKSQLKNCRGELVRQKKKVPGSVCIRRKQLTVGTRNMHALGTKPRGWGGIYLEVA